MKTNKLFLCVFFRYSFSVFCALALSIPFRMISQSTLNIDSTKNSFNTSATSFTKHKILIVPFNSKMYMSEIDHVINAETNQNQKQIRYAFQDAIDAQLYRTLKTKFEVVSLFEDTAKNKKEIALVISGVGYKYDKIPEQKKYKSPKSDYKQDGKTKNGQIVADVNNDSRFMNAKIQNKEMLATLNKKFKTDVFVFINELDLKGSMVTNDFNADKNRTAIIHYTVFNLLGKEINSGIVSTKFPKSINSPEKITTNYISKALQEISMRVDNALNPTAVTTEK